MYVRPYISPHVPAQLLLDWFPWNLIFEAFIKICWGSLNLVKIGQNILSFTWSSSSSIGSAALVGFGLLNYHCVFSAGRILQSAVASGTSNPQSGGPVIRTFHLSPQGVPSVWNDASEPQQRKVELWARNCREFCRNWRLPRHFWVLLHAVNLRHGTDGFTSPPKEDVLRIFSPEKSDGFGRELGYQRPARSPLDHRSLTWSSQYFYCCWRH